jgi:hypothetical protein
MIERGRQSSATLTALALKIERASTLEFNRHRVAEMTIGHLAIRICCHYQISEIDYFGLV